MPTTTTRQKRRMPKTMARIRAGPLEDETEVVEAVLLLCTEDWVAVICLELLDGSGNGDIVDEKPCVVVALLSVEVIVTESKSTQSLPVTISVREWVPCGS